MIALTLAFFCLPPAYPHPVPVTNNLRTVDPCSVANQVQQQMAYLGETEIYAHTDNFNICDVVINPADGSSQVDAQVQVEHPGPLDSDAISTTKNGPITVDWEQLANDDCARVVTTPDIAFNLDVFGHRADLCQLADVETRAVVPGSPTEHR